MTPVAKIIRTTAQGLSGPQGGQGPQGVPGQTQDVSAIQAGNAPPSNGSPAGIQISGVLFLYDSTTTTTKPCAFPVLYQNSNTLWTDDGLVSTGRAYETALYYATGRWFAEIRWNGGVLGQWQANAAANTGSPLDAAGWAPVGPSTGVPSLAAVAAVAKTSAVTLAARTDAIGQIWGAAGSDPAHTNWVSQQSSLADWYDDFSLYPDGTVLTAGFMPQVNSGSGYLVPPGDVGLPTVTGGKVYDLATGSTTWYRGVRLNRLVSSFVGAVMWEDVNGAAGVSDFATILIMPRFDNWLDSLIHIRISLSAIFVEFSTRAGTNGFVRSYSTTDGTLQNGLASLVPGRRHRIVVKIDGNTLRISVGGVHNEITDRRVGQNNGHYIFIESVGVVTTRVRWLRAGANCPKLLDETDALQASAAALDDLCRYSTRYPVALRNASGGKLGTTGAFNYITPLGAPVSTSANAVNQQLTPQGHVINYGDLAPVGTRLVYKASGLFAANGNAKRLLVPLVDRNLDSGSIAISGGMWQAEMSVLAVSTSSYQVVAKLVTVDGSGASKTVLQTWTNINISYNAGFGILASGVSAGDVIMIEETADMVPLAPPSYL